MKLLEILKKLKTEVLKGEKRLNICHYVPVGYMETLREKLAEWPEGTGCLSYPVPAPSGYEHQDTEWYNTSLKLEIVTKEMALAEDCFDHCEGRFWKGEYGESRMRLLDWLIKELENETTTDS